MSEKMLVTLTMLSFLVATLSQGSNAATYTVGDSTGWRFNVAGWEKGKNFKAGDILVFNYSPMRHNVVVVDKASYDSCTPPTPGSTVTYNTGSDNIQLLQGHNYFICSFPGHCAAGMKIDAFVAPN